ncbi:MAG: beta-lactamase family protein [Phycisphaerales bacterium]|nr:beta-lactamase family protein [Phycisphaerales bacterium]
MRIKHLLTHTSGLGSYFTEEWDRSSRGLYHTVDDWKPIVAHETLAFEPGTSWQYSNTGMLLAGAIIESVTGGSYYDYIREHVTGPAGMTDSGFFETDHVNRNLAVGYEPIEGSDPLEYRNNLYLHVVRGGPAGGGYSTVHDLFRFGQALRAHKLVGQDSLDQLWRTYPELGSATYGLGFGVLQTPAGRVVGHSGGFPGISASLNMYLDEGYTIAVLANLGDVASMVDERARMLIAQGR